jgi:hypothetical protein
VTDCLHPRLIKEEGPLHPIGNEYRCLECKQFLIVEIKPSEITEGYGKIKE